MSVTALKQSYIEAVQAHQTKKYAHSLAMLDTIEVDCMTAPRVQHFRALNLIALEEFDEALVAVERQANLINTIRKNCRKLREQLSPDFAKDLNTSLNEQYSTYENTRISLETKAAEELDKALLQQIAESLKEEMAALHKELEQARETRQKHQHALEELQHEPRETAETAQAARGTTSGRMAQLRYQLGLIEKNIADIQHVIAQQEHRISQTERMLGRKKHLHLDAPTSLRTRAILILISLVGGIAFVMSLMNHEAPQQQPLITERTLPFPTGYSMGTLYVRDARDTDASEWIPFADEAQGELTVNDKLQIHMRLSEEATDNLEALRELPPNALHSIWLPEFEPTPENLETLKHFTELEELIIQEAATPEEIDIIQEALPNIRLETLPPEVIAEAESRTPPEAQQFNFPSAQSVGRIMLRPWSITSSETWQDYANAQGAVDTPAEYEVKLQLNEAAGGDLAFLSDLEPDALHTLALVGNQVNNDDVEYVRQLTGLKGLELRYTSITDEGMLRLSVLTQLEEVILLNIDMTDTGFAVFANFPNLRILYILQAQLSNRSIPLIRQMRGLRLLHLERSGISREGLITLRFDLPQANVTPVDM